MHRRRCASHTTFRVNTIDRSIDRIFASFGSPSFLTKIWIIIFLLFGMLEKNNIHKYTTFSSFKITLKSCIKMQNTQTSLEKEELKRRRKNRNWSRSKTRRNVIQHFSRPFSQSFASFLSPRGNHIDYRQGLAPLPLHSTTRSASIPHTPVSLPLLFPALAFFLSLTLISHSIRRSRSVVTPLRLYKFYIIFMRHKVVEKPTKGGEKRYGWRGFPTSKLVPPSLSFPSLRRPVVTWLGGAVFNPLVLGNHVWGKKRRDAPTVWQGKGFEGKKAGSRRRGLCRGISLVCLGLLKKFPNRPPLLTYLRPAQNSTPSSPPLHACTRNPVSKQIRAVILAVMGSFKNEYNLIESNRTGFLEILLQMD